MPTRNVMLLAAAGSVLFATSVPASAQIVDDFLCSTFSYKCNQQPPLPPPQLAPATAPVPEPEKHAASHKHKAKHKTAKTDASKADPANAGNGSK